MSEWLGLIGGAVTYFVAGQQHRHERQLETHKRLIASYEAIHKLLSNSVGQASTLNMGVIGDLGYSTPLKGDVLKEKMQLDRLRMLVDFYAPSLAEECEENFTSVQHPLSRRRRGPSSEGTQ